VDLWLTSQQKKAPAKTMKPWRSLTIWHQLSLGTIENDTGFPV
jgi:hypothetical protein